MPALLDENNTCTVQTFTNPVGARVMVSRERNPVPDCLSRPPHTTLQNDPTQLTTHGEKNARASPYDETPSVALVDYDNHPFAMT